MEETVAQPRKVPSQASGARSRAANAASSVAARQYGVLSCEQLTACGVTDSMLRHWGSMGHSHRIHYGVYALGHPRLSRDARDMAAVLACGTGSALARRSAGARWLLLPEARGPVEVVSYRDRRQPGIQNLVTTDLRPEAVTFRDSIPITTVTRTVLDLAAVLPREALSKVLHEAQVRRLLNPADLVATLRECPGRRGAATLRALLGDGVPRTRSELERRFLLLARRAGLPVPETNIAIDLEAQRFEVDVLWPAQRLVVELDGYGFHGTRRAFERDRERDQVLAAAGYVTLRCTWRQLEDAPRETIERLAGALARRS